MRHTTRLKLLTMYTLFSLALFGCQNFSDRQNFGTFTGALAGGLIGAQFGKGDGKLVGAAVGAAAGSMIGYHIAGKLDKRDQRLAQEALHQSTERPLGETITWDNPDTGHHGKMIATRQGKSESGQLCREVKHVTYMQERSQVQYHTLCRFKDEQWYLMQSL